MKAEQDLKAQYDVVILGRRPQWPGRGELSWARGVERSAAGKERLHRRRDDVAEGLSRIMTRGLSRYSYLVSLFPEKIIRDLGLKLELRRRATGSFTPYLRNGEHRRPASEQRHRRKSVDSRCSI